MSQGEGGTLAMVVEVPRWSFVKYEIAPGQAAQVDYVSPLPCPFHYGSLDGALGPDGDPPDAVLLDDRAAKPGDRRVGYPVGRVRFVDAGLPDDKLILTATLRAPTRRERALIVGFFTLYAPLRAILNRLRRLPGQTVFRGVVWQD